MVRKFTSFKDICFLDRLKDMSISLKNRPALLDNLSRDFDTKESGFFQREVF